MPTHFSPSKLIIITAALLLNIVSGQEMSGQEILPHSSSSPLTADSGSSNNPTNESDEREVSKVIPLKYVKANWAVRNIEQLFKKQKGQFSIIGDDEKQIVVRADRRLIDEIIEVVVAIDRPEEPRIAPSPNAPGPNAVAKGISEKITLKDVEIPEGRDRLKAALRKEFELNQNQLRESLMELSTRIKAAQELLERRDQLADEIIDLRFKELTAAKASGVLPSAAESARSLLSNAPLSATSSGLEATATQAMRKPDEYVRLLQVHWRNYRYQTESRTSRLAVIDKLSKVENLDSQDENRLKLEKQDLVLAEKGQARSLGDWKRAWSEYQTQLQLLRLDIQEAEKQLSFLARKVEQANKQYSEGSLSQTELSEQSMRLDLAVIKVERAQQIYQLFAEIEKSEPELNPNDVKMLPLDTSAE